MIGLISDSCRGRKIGLTWAEGEGRGARFTYHLCDIVDNVCIWHREEISGAGQIALGEHFREQLVHLRLLLLC